MSALNTGFHAAFVGAAVIALVGAMIAVVSLRQPRPATVEPTPDAARRALLGETD